MITQKELERLMQECENDPAPRLPVLDILDMPPSCAHRFFDGSSAWAVREGNKGFWRQCRLCGELEEQ